MIVVVGSGLSVSAVMCVGLVWSVEGYWLFSAEDVKAGKKKSNRNKKV